MPGIGAEVFCRRLRATPDAANQSRFFGQFIGRPRLGGLSQIGLQSFADKRRLGLPSHPRAMAKALPQRLWNANGDAVGCHVRHYNINVRHVIGDWAQPLALPTKRVPHPSASFAEDGTRTFRRAAASTLTNVTTSTGCDCKGALPALGCRAPNNMPSPGSPHPKP